MLRSMGGSWNGEIVVEVGFDDGDYVVGGSS